MVKQIKDILSTDITSLDNQEKLEEFKRDASAYGEQAQQPSHPQVICKVVWVVQMSDSMSQALDIIKLGWLQLAFDTA